MIIILSFFWGVFYFLIPARLPKTIQFQFIIFRFRRSLKRQRIFFPSYFRPRAPVASAHTVFHMDLVREQFIRQTLPPKNNGISLKMLGGGVEGTRKNKTKSDNIVGRRCSYIIYFYFRVVFFFSIYIRFIAVFTLFNTRTLFN